MRLRAMAMITLALALAPGGPGSGPGGGGAALAAEGRPDLAVDDAQLPPLPTLYSKAERTQRSLAAAGVGAVGGVVIADAVTGGLLLAPLGLPTFATLLAAAPSVPAGAAAVPAPAYTLIQQVLAGVASIVAALGGGYIGMHVAGPPTEP